MRSYTYTRTRPLIATKAPKNFEIHSPRFWFRKWRKLGPRTSDKCCSWSTIRDPWSNSQMRAPYSRNEVITKVTKRRLPKYPDTYDYGGPLLFIPTFLFDGVLGKLSKRSLGVVVSTEHRVLLKTSRMYLEGLKYVMRNRTITLFGPLFRLISAWTVRSRGY